MKSDVTFWDKLAPRYALSPISNMDAYHHTLDRTRSYLGADDNVLELGCGTGSTALELAASAAHITATDFAHGMLKVAAGKVETQGVTNVDFVQMGASDQQLGDRVFDVVLAFNLLHLLPDLDETLRQNHHRLKPGGLLISKTPCLGETGLGMKFGLIKRAIPLLQMIGKAPFVNLISIANIEAAITNAGFEIIETGNFPPLPPSRYIVARKT